MALQIGWQMPHMGVWTSTDGIDAVAERAEELGYDSLWAAGVSHLLLSGGGTLPGLLELMDRFAKEVLPAVR